MKKPLLGTLPPTFGPGFTLSCAWPDTPRTEDGVDCVSRDTVAYFMQQKP